MPRQDTTGKQVLLKTLGWALIVLVALAIGSLIRGCNAAVWSGTIGAACNYDLRFEKPCAEHPAERMEK